MPFEPPQEFNLADWFPDARLGVLKIGPVVVMVNPRRRSA
jgi:hypothetical protein